MWERGVEDDSGTSGLFIMSQGSIEKQNQKDVKELAHRRGWRWANPESAL